MNDSEKIDPERAMLENSLAFFGAITASVSHELNNVMAIIDQNNGLMADLLIGATPERPISNERLHKIAESITAQTERGVRIIKRLNSFAHSVDDPIREFNLIQLVDNFIRLAQRLASLRKVTLESRHSETELSVQSSPFLLQQILFMCIQRALTMSQPGDVIQVETCLKDAGVQIKVKGRRDAVEIPDWDQAYATQLVSFMQGILEIKAEDDRETSLISFPLKAH
jgi:C4-dicarboxylate-specific signal transduction histidine kinase